MPKRVDDPPLREVLKETLNALERLMRLFQVERIVHLVVGVVAFLLLVYGITLLFRSGPVTTELMVSLFGSAGLITASSARITYFFNRAFGLVEEVIRSLLKTSNHE